MSAENRCPACLDGVTSQRETYLYARRYLCAPYHLSLWDAANAHAHVKGELCPQYPERCLRTPGCAMRPHPDTITCDQESAF